MTNTPPKTHAEVAEKLWKRLLDADVDACNPDCDDQTRGPVAILTTALRDANIEGMIEMAHKYVEKGGAIPVPPGHILDDDGNVRRVLGTLPVTADGCVVGQGGVIFPLFGVANEDGGMIRCRYFVVDSFDGAELAEDDELNIGKCYSDREAALTAKDAHAGE